MPASAEDQAHHAETPQNTVHTAPSYPTHQPTQNTAWSDSSQEAFLSGGQRPHSSRFPTQPGYGQVPQSTYPGDEGMPPSTYPYFSQLAGGQPQSGYFGTASWASHVPSNQSAEIQPPPNYYNPHTPNRPGCLPRNYFSTRINPSTRSQAEQHPTQARGTQFGNSYGDHHAKGSSTHPSVESDGHRRKQSVRDPSISGHVPSKPRQRVSTARNYTGNPTSRERERSMEPPRQPRNASRSKRVRQPYEIEESETSDEDIGISARLLICDQGSGSGVESGGERPYGKSHSQQAPASTHPPVTTRAVEQGISSSSKYGGLPRNPDKDRKSQKNSARYPSPLSRQEISRDTLARSPLIKRISDQCQPAQSHTSQHQPDQIRNFEIKNSQRVTRLVRQPDGKHNAGSGPLRGRSSEIDFETSQVEAPFGALKSSALEQRYKETYSRKIRSRKIKNTAKQMGYI